jgi:hypothetical protein
VTCLLWKIYYANGVTRTNLDHDIIDHGVVGIVNVDRTDYGIGWTLQSQRNFYCLIDGVEWWACNYPGLLNYLADHLGTACVLRGAMVSNEQWSNFFDLLKSDPELPQKSGRKQDEIVGDETFR